MEPILTDEYFVKSNMKAVIFENDKEIGEIFIDKHSAAMLRAGQGISLKIFSYEVGYRD
jgi:hypothetical protein